jgi:NADPH-dependent 2,4-dienoyl-CoA reductase/sulfur reductase-like enzyme
MRVVIVGGVAGGATTAARLRRIDENAEVIIFERGEHISYANCGLPYYIGGVIEERDRLFVQTPESFYSNYRLEVRTKQEVLSIDRDRKEVTVRKVDTGEEYTESYDKLVLSPGAEPFKPPIPGINSEGIFTLRSVPETDAIKAFVDERSPKRAVIVGAGFIGLEMAENLHDRGVFVTIVEMAQQVMNVVDFEMAAMVHQHLKTKNVEFYLRTAYPVLSGTATPSPSSSRAAVLSPPTWSSCQSEFAPRAASRRRRDWTSGRPGVSRWTPISGPPTPTSTRAAT